MGSCNSVATVIKVKQLLGKLSIFHPLNLLIVEIVLNKIQTNELKFHQLKHQQQFEILLYYQGVHLPIYLSYF